MSKPEVLIDEEVISGGAGATLATLGDLSIRWGTESLLDEPEPSTATVTFMFSGGVDVGRIGIGKRLIIRQRIASTTPALFAGLIQTATARTDHKNRLHITVTATDSLKDFRSAYAQLAWPADSLPGTTKYLELIRKAMAVQGWELKGDEDLAPPLYPSSSSFYNSITLYTVLRRYLAQYGPQVTFWDSSGTDPRTGKWERSIQVGYMGATNVGDTLAARSTDGTWHVTRDTPSGLSFGRISASKVLQDMSWKADLGAALTVAKVSYQVTRTETNEDGSTEKITSMSEVSTEAGADLIARYGRRPVELETSMLAPHEEQRRIGRKWLQFGASEWVPGSVTIPDTYGLDDETLAGLLPSTARRRKWWVITDVATWTPRGGPATIRGVATGGELIYHAKPKPGRPEGHWEVSMSLTDTQVILPSDFTFAQLAAAGEPFASTPADHAGTVQFSEFETITRFYTP